MCIPWEGTRNLPQGCLIVSWLSLPCLCIPFLPWAATVWTLGAQERLWWLNEAHFLRLRKGGPRKDFVPRSPAGPCSVPVSINNGSQSSQSAASSKAELVSPEGTQQGDQGDQEYLPSLSHPIVASPKGEPSGCEKDRILAPGSWGVYQGKDFSEPRIYIFPHREKHQIPWLETSGFLLLTVIFCSYYMPFVTKLLYILAHPLPPQSSFSGLFEMLPLGLWSSFGPKN